MRRRDFVVLLSTLGAISPAAVSAQRGRKWRIGQVVAGEPEKVQQLPRALEAQLAELGLSDGKTITLLTRFAAPQPKAVEDAIAELLPEIDLLATWGTIVAVAAKKLVPPTLPVVFHAVGDPVAIGLVESLSRPGGNMTGITFEAAMEMYGKRLQFLKEIVPALRRVAVLRATGDVNAVPSMSALEQAAGQLGMNLVVFDFSSPDQLDQAFGRMKASSVEAVTVIAGAATYANSKRVADLALAHGLPSSHGFKESVQDGGLISVGPNLVAMARQGANYISKIVAGAKPADLPVEQPSQHEVVVNLRTARLLGLSIPNSLSASADLVVE